jgi:hypothetical protein
MLVPSQCMVVKVFPSSDRFSPTRRRDELVERSLALAEPASAGMSDLGRFLSGAGWIALGKSGATVERS